MKTEKVDYIELGSCPDDEAPGVNAFFEKMFCELYIEQLRRIFGKEPKNCKLAIKHFECVHGGYNEVVCYYDSTDEIAVKWAYNIDDNLPLKWDSKNVKKITKTA